MIADLESDLAALAHKLRLSTVAVRSARGAGSGSGVIWSAGGTIVTNAHVARSPLVEIELPDGRRLPGTVERRDERRDLARIRIAAVDLTAAQIGDPKNLRVGEVVVAFGHPLGVPNVLSTGIVYARHRAGGGRFVFSDIKLAPGNSGGALAAIDGQIVGINSMIAGDLALAIPTDDVRRFMGEGRPARLGVRLAPVRLGDRRQAYAVLAIEPGSRAARAGLIVGDVILTGDLDALAERRSLEIMRGGESVRVALDPQSEAAAAA